MNIQKNLGTLLSNFEIYRRSIENGMASPDDINDAKNIANELREGAAQYPALQSAIAKFDEVEKKYAPAYAKLSKNQRPAETANLSGDISNNVHQQSKTSGKSPEEIGKAALENLMNGGTASTDNSKTTQSTATSQKKTTATTPKSTQQTARPYQVGDPSPTTGQPLTAQQVSILSKQGAKYTPTQQQGNASQNSAGSSPTNNGNSPSNGGSSPSTTQNNGTSGTANTSGSAGLSVLQGYLDNGTIDAGTFAYFKQALDLFPEGSPVNIDTVLKTFNDLKKTTIDPYWQEQTKIFTDQLDTARKNLETSQKDESTAVGTQNKLNIENAQGNLEASGMTFSGAAGKQLGDQSAYGTKQGAIPMQKFGEGLVQTQNKLSSSSSNARYQDNLQKLQRQAETTLGTSGVAGMFPEVKALGGITGTMTEQKKQAEASTLQQIYNQQVDNYNASQPIKVFQ